MNKLIDLNTQKQILIILDGVSEEKIPALSDKTPLEYANTQNLDKILGKSIFSKRIFYPKDLVPDSLNCIMTILGVPSKCIPKNRAYLEALATDIPVNDDEVVMRCNLITVKDGKLNSFNGGKLSKTEMEKLSNNLKNIDGISFHHMSEYRNLIVLKKSAQLLKLKDCPPHENVGKSMEFMLEDIKNIKILYDFIIKNTYKIDDLQYMLYPWGVATISKIPTFFELYHKRASLVAKAEIVKGIGKAMGINVAELKNATGDVDTDLSEKALAVINEIHNTDFVICHINGTDEVSHRKDYTAKVKFIEKIDKELFAPIFKNIDNNTKITILSDHRTSSLTGKHEYGFVEVIEYFNSEEN